MTIQVVTMSIHDHAPHDLFVAPGGDDAAPGTLEEPVASLQRARDLLRARPAAERAALGAITVWVRGGDYLLPAGLRLTAEDSGTADAPVTWRACPGERVRLIGGVRVGGFEPWRDEILQADLATPLAAAGMDEIPPHLPKRYQVDPDAAPESCELYLDGKRQTAARWPNARREPGKAGRWAYVAGVRDDLDWLLEPEGSVFNAGSERVRGWQHNPEDIQVHVFTNPNWADDVLNLDHVDGDTGELWLHPSAPAAGHAHFEAGGRFYVKHVLEELDEPGEYYIDRPARRLYFWPPAGSADGLAVVTTAESVVVTDGASHLTLRDFVIQSARGCAVVIRGGSHVTVAGGSVSGAGAWGVLVKGGCRHRVRGCALLDLGRGGVYLRGGDRFTLEAQRPPGPQLRHPALRPHQHLLPGRHQAARGRQPRQQLPHPPRRPLRRRDPRGLRQHHRALRDRRCLPGGGRCRRHLPVHELGQGAGQPDDVGQRRAPLPDS